MDKPVYDVIIVGGGPAGMSAALVLARCDRRVLLLDEGRPRNRLTEHLHNFITCDGIPPAEFKRKAREDLLKYENVSIREEHVLQMEQRENLFRLTIGENAESISGRRVLLATGVIDKLPLIEGISELYGKSVFHCPYCDAFEYRGTRMAAYGRGESGFKLALTLLVWSNQVILCTDGTGELSGEHREILANHQVPVYETPITRLERKKTELTGISFEDGTSVDCKVLFFATGRYERLSLADDLGCDFEDNGCIKTLKHRVTSIDGLFAAGDLTRDVQFVIVAAAQGAQAATGINLSLLEEDLKSQGTQIEIAPEHTADV